MSLQGRSYTISNISLIIHYQYSLLSWAIAACGWFRCCSTWRSGRHHYCGTSYHSATYGVVCNTVWLVSRKKICSFLLNNSILRVTFLTTKAILNKWDCKEKITVLPKRNRDAQIAVFHSPSTWCDLACQGNSWIWWLCGIRLRILLPLPTCRDHHLRIFAKVLEDKAQGRKLNWPSPDFQQPALSPVSNGTSLNLAYILSLAILWRKISLMRRRDTFILSIPTISAYSNAYPRRGRS